MKHLFSICMGLWMTASVWAANGINYDGTTLSLTTSFTRSECGTASKKVVKEVSGLAASRTTPGFLWAHGDENAESSDKKIVAIKPSGELAMTVSITGDPGRDDWEDIATGSMNGTRYIFLGAFGDNDLAFKDTYYIYYFEEPAITSGTVSKSVNYIRFGYPDNKAHNTETLMYDSVEHMLYIADKVDGGACALYSLPFRTDYGTTTQKLTKVCDLGTGNKFELVCGGDISPDGKWMAIKNREYVLLWERQGQESLAQTALRRPLQIAAYQEEEQGESLAWSDSTTFYTTSDSKSNVPIYKYVRSTGSSPSVDPATDDPQPAAIDSAGKSILEVILSNNYSAYILPEDTVIRGFYLAGTETPTVLRYLVTDSATWTQNEDTVLITALDGSAQTYTLDIQPVAPRDFTADEIVFDGSESAWVKAPYGWDETKKWKFSKTDTDYSREIAGKTHLELFLPACDTLFLTPFSGNERKVQFYVNGEATGSSVKFEKTGLTLVVNQSAPFMLTISSAQSSGDGGIAALRMARKQTTGIENLETSTPSPRKICVQNHIYILYRDTIYTITGQPIPGLKP